jgi:hypothetical protein
MCFRHWPNHFTWFILSNTPSTLRDGDCHYLQEEKMRAQDFYFAGQDPVGSQEGNVL